MKPDKSALDRWLDASLEEFGVSVRIRHALNWQGVLTVKDLILCTDNTILLGPATGETTLIEVKQRLQERGLRLGMRLRGGEWTYGDEP